MKLESENKIVNGVEWDDWQIKETKPKSSKR